MSSQEDLANELRQLRREFTDLKEQLHQAFAMASAANVRIDPLIAMIEGMGRRIDNLRVDITAIAKIDG